MKKKDLAFRTSRSKIMTHHHHDKDTITNMSTRTNTAIMSMSTAAVSEK